MSQLLRELAGHYDLVVVDASSLAHRGTVQLAAVCDATYLVVRLGEGSPRMLREAAQVVQCNGGRLLGCVAIDAVTKARCFDGLPSVFCYAPHWRLSGPLLLFPPTSA